MYKYCLILKTGSNNKAIARHMQFYTPAYILAPSTITTTAINLAASHLFYKGADFTSAPTSATKHQLSLSTNAGVGAGSGAGMCGIGESVSLLPHFVQLTLSNSHYGFLNGQNNYNYNLGELILSQQQLLTGQAGVTNSLSLLANGLSGTAALLGLHTGTGVLGTAGSGSSTTSSSAASQFASSNGLTNGYEAV